MISESDRAVVFPVMRVTQPIGSFFVGKMSAKELIDISWFDVRRKSGDTDLDEYLGIQRRVSAERVIEIAKYVTLSDATFPTAVILAVEGRCVEIVPVEADPSTFFKMKLQNVPGDFDDPSTVLFRGIARVLDGQHRIRGLAESTVDLTKFEVNVCLFVDADIADQASIFATVNLAQTKVNKSLVYDLQAYSTSRSPERTCHAVTVTLDSQEQSPLLHRIKRLGVATEGRFDEVLTQATVVQALLPYITKDVLRDRDIGRRFGWGRRHDNFDRSKLIFRQWFLDERDPDIALQMMYYFEAVRRRWPSAWSQNTKGNILPRTNGFRALMRFLRPAFNELHSSELVKMSQFSDIFSRVRLSDDDFNTSNFPPGSTGEGKLFNKLMEDSGLRGRE
jgi:DGQHR domain-containing protein